MKDRKIAPLATKIVNVPTHYVTFDVFGIPYSEPCYASIEEFPDGGSGNLQLSHGNNCFEVPSLCGLAHLLTPSDFHRLLVTEGSGVVYDIIEVQAYELDESRRTTDEPLTAYTLKARWPQRPNGTPSARYVVRSQQIKALANFNLGSSRSADQQIGPLPKGREREQLPSRIYQLPGKLSQVPQARRGQPILWPAHL